MSGYVKLFSSILASTIWSADNATRLVWITMLAMSDKHGHVEASVPGLAVFARVSLEECERALTALQAPDAWSRSKEHEGRRVEAIDGGWRLINHSKYRALLGAEERREYLRVKQQESRARRSTLVNTRQQGVDGSTQSTDPDPDPDPSPDPDQRVDPKKGGEDAPAPVWRNAAKPTPLVGNHRGCFEAPSACARGLCVPAWLGQQWRQQLGNANPETDRDIREFVAAELARLKDGAIGDKPSKFWEAAWSARHGSQAPAHAPIASGRETIAAYNHRESQELLAAAKGRPARRRGELE